MRRALATAFAIGGLIGGTLAAAAPAGAEGDPPEQWRSYWVDAFNEGIYNPDQVSTLVADALEINANALIVQTVRRYDCFCNDAQYPRTHAAVAPEPYDPLAAIIEEAHAAGLEVHAWVNVNTLWNQAAAPPQADHIFNTNGPTAEGRDRWLNKRADGAEFIGNNVFVDPGHPDVQDYIVSGIQSLLTGYDLDGIHLDYVRYPDFNSTTEYSDWGYNETSVARFQAATGRSDVPAASDPEWADWRRNQVTNLVRKIYLGMWEVDPQARLSMAGVTYGFGPQGVGGWEQTRTFAEVLQDWRAWLAEGIMDTMVAMNYKRNWLPPQDEMFSQWSEFLADNQAARQAVDGPALYLNSVEDIVEQVHEIIEPTAVGNVAAGWSGYSYANPSNAFVDGPWADRSAERAALAAALTAPGAPFEHRAAVPEMTWKTTATEGHVTGTLVLNDGTPLDQVTVMLQVAGGGAAVTGTTDGSGWFGFAHVAPGRYVVRVDRPHGVDGQLTTPVRVGAGQIAEATFRNLQPAG
ncbi:MAG TPA: family 10 glycosylhydrolase [Jiangellaceae bacterium]|nr:family 10 glycosylhydrolase [Jiangellaceae bacterium]